MRGKIHYLLIIAKPIPLIKKALAFPLVLLHKKKDLVA